MRNFLYIVNAILLLTLQVVFSATTPSTPADNCFLPNFRSLEGLQFRIQRQNTTIVLGSSVENFKVIDIECKGSQILNGASSLICRNGEWNDTFPTCESYCDGTLLERLSWRTLCDYRDQIAKCPQKIESGTYIQLRCSYGYKSKKNMLNTLRCLPDGSFDKIPERCEPRCGHVAPHTTALLAHGIEIETSVAPWHVAIYMENRGGQHDYICSGSIVSHTVIISAAHCFWDEANKTPFNFTNLQVVAGQSSRNYSTAQTKYSQVIKVQKVHIPEEYRGKAEQYQDDIAFLQLAEPLKYSETISPVCFPREMRNSASRYVLSNLNGAISIFGKNDRLERIEMKTLAYHDCVTATLVASDKFCAHATDDDVVWWSGNSGAGFLTAKIDLDTNEKHFHLRGVLSHSVYSKPEGSPIVGKKMVAITNIFSSPHSFKRELLDAIKQDDALL